MAEPTLNPGPISTAGRAAEVIRADRPHTGWPFLTPICRIKPSFDPLRRSRLAREFYTTGMEHSPTSATGTGWERTPWHATQWAGRWDC